MILGDNSVSLRRIWTKLWGNSSYKPPPEASYTAQGPQKQPEIIKSMLHISSTKNDILGLRTWIQVSKPLESVPARKFHVESEL